MIWGGGRSRLIPTLPEDKNCRPRLARKVLYIRSHWLRMLPLLLVRHLLTKTPMRYRK